MKVLLIVIDGFSYYLFERFRYNLETLNYLAENGIYGKLESVFPSLTPVALASLFTGVNPQVHGIIGPKMSAKGRKLSNPLSAYDSNSLLVDPMWVTLAKKGYKVLITSAPQALPDKWKLKNLILFDPYKAKLKHCSKGYLIKEGSNNILGKEWVVRKSDNRFIITYPSTSSNNQIELNKNEWSRPIEFYSYCKDKEVKGVTILHARDDDIYITPPAFFINTWSNSQELLEKVWNNVILKVGMVLDGDYKSLNLGLINFDEYMKTVELANQFFREYSMFLLKNTDWDFAVTYLPIVDNLQHLVYGIDDGKALDILLWAYKMSDSFVHDQLGLADYTIICSDHGITKVKKRVYVNKILEKINVLKIDNEKGIDWNHSKAYYLGGGHIRINLRGRENNGIVSREEFPKLVNYIAKNLEKIEDKESGERVFTTIIVKEIPSNNREGDIIINISDSFSISSDTREHEIIENVVPYKTITADHGYYRREDLFGILIIYNSNNKKGKRINNMKIIDIAPTILKIFGISSEMKTDGKVLGGI